MGLIPQRRFLLLTALLAGAVASGAQDKPAPAPPPAAVDTRGDEMESRKQLLARRVTELYELYKIPSWRKAEGYMTEESKDIFYEMPKGQVLEYAVKSVEVSRDGLSGTAGVEIKFRLAGFPQPLTLVQPSRWVYESGNWFLKLDKQPQPHLGGFGDNLPVSAYKNAVLRFTKFVQEAPRGAGEFVFHFQSAGKEPLQAQAMIQDCGVCLSAQFDKPRYEPGETGRLVVRARVDDKSRPGEHPIRVFIMPGRHWIVLKLAVKTM